MSEKIRIEFETVASADSQVPSPVSMDVRSCATPDAVAEEEGDDPEKLVACPAEQCRVCLSSKCGLCGLWRRASRQGLVAMKGDRLEPVTR